MNDWTWPTAAVESMPAFCRIYPTRSASSAHERLVRPMPPSQPSADPGQGPPLDDQNECRPDSVGYDIPPIRRAAEHHAQHRFGDRPMMDKRHVLAQLNCAPDAKGH